MIKTIKVDTLNKKSINKAFIAIGKLDYKFNFKIVSKIKFADLNTAGHKVLSEKHNINTLGDMSKLNFTEMKNLKGIGPKAAISIRDVMCDNDIDFKIIPKGKTIAAKAKVIK